MIVDQVDGVHWPLSITRLKNHRLVGSVLLSYFMG